MAKRRGNSEGSIYKRPSGKWRAQITSNGSRHSFTGNTQRQCQEWINDFRIQKAKASKITAGETKLMDFLPVWISSIRSSRARNTVFTYEWIMNKRIIPFIGNIALEDLSPDKVQDFYRRLLSQGLSNHAVHVTHKVLNSALGHAQKMRRIISNPCKGTSPPKPDQSEMKIFDENKSRIFLTAAQDYEDQYYSLYYLAIHTGMRQGELLGLKWIDVNWENSSLVVQRQVIRVRGEGFHFTKPKSRLGNRTIVLGQGAIKILKNQKMVAKEKRTNSGDAWTDYDLVFPTNVGTPILDSNLRRGFRNTLKWAGLSKIRFHDLRHTAASLMLNNGIPLMVVSRRLGHSKPSITLDVYGHLIPSKQQDAAELMDKVLES